MQELDDIQTLMLDITDRITMENPGGDGWGLSPLRQIQHIDGPIHLIYEKIDLDHAICGQSVKNPYINNGEFVYHQFKWTPRALRLVYDEGEGAKKLKEHICPSCLKRAIDEQFVRFAVKDAKELLYHLCGGLFISVEPEQFDILSDKCYLSQTHHAVELNGLSVIRIRPYEILNSVKYGGYKGLPYEAAYGNVEFIKHNLDVKRLLKSELWQYFDHYGISVNFIDENKTPPNQLGKMHQLFTMDVKKYLHTRLMEKIKE